MEHSFTQLPETDHASGHPSLLPSNELMKVFLQANSLNDGMEHAKYPEDVEDACDQALSKAAWKTENIQEAKALLLAYARSVRSEVPRFDFCLQRLALNVRARMEEQIVEKRIDNSRAWAEGLMEQILGSQAERVFAGADGVIIEYMCQRHASLSSDVSSNMDTWPPAICPSQYASLPLGGVSLLEIEDCMTILLASNPMECRDLIYQTQVQAYPVFEREEDELLGRVVAVSGGKTCADLELVRPLNISSWSSGAALWLQALAHRKEEALKAELDELLQYMADARSAGVKAPLTQSVYGNYNSSIRQLVARIWSSQGNTLEEMKELLEWAKLEVEVLDQIIKSIDGLKPTSSHLPRKVGKSRPTTATIKASAIVLQYMMINTRDVLDDYRKRNTPEAFEIWEYKRDDKGQGCSVKVRWGSGLITGERLQSAIYNCDAPQTSDRPIVQTDIGINFANISAQISAEYSFQSTVHEEPFVRTPLLDRVLHTAMYELHDSRRGILVMSEDAYVDAKFGASYIIRGVASLLGRRCLFFNCAEDTPEIAVRAFVGPLGSASLCCNAFLIFQHAERLSLACMQLLVELQQQFREAERRISGGNFNLMVIIGALEKLDDMASKGLGTVSYQLASDPKKGQRVSDVCSFVGKIIPDFLWMSETDAHSAGLPMAGVFCRFTRDSSNWARKLWGSASQGTLSARVCSERLLGWEDELPPHIEGSEQQQRLLDKAVALYQQASVRQKEIYDTHPASLPLEVMSDPSIWSNRDAGDRGRKSVEKICLTWAIETGSRNCVLRALQARDRACRLLSDGTYCRVPGTYHTLPLTAMDMALLIARYPDEALSLLTKRSSMVYQGDNSSMKVVLPEFLVLDAVLPAVLESQRSRDILVTPAIRTLLSVKWETIFWLWLLQVIFVVTLCAIYVLNFMDHDETDQTTSMVVTMLAAFFLLCETLEMSVSLAPALYLQTSRRDRLWSRLAPVNIVDTLSTLAVFLQSISTSSWCRSPQVLASTVFLLQLKLVISLRALPTFGFLVSMIFNAVSMMGGFLIMLAIVVVGFAFIFQILLPSQETDSTFLEERFVWIWRMYLLVGLGEMYHDATLFETDAWTRIFFLLVTLLVNVVMLNLLISIVSEGYIIAKNDQIFDNQKWRAEVIMELERVFLWPFSSWQKRRDYDCKLLRGYTCSRNLKVRAEAQIFDQD